MKKNMLNMLLILTALVLLPTNVYAFQLDVSYGEDTYTIEAESSDVIEDVKTKIETETGVEVKKQVLKKNTTLLEEGRSLGDYNITAENTPTITLTLKKEIKTIKYVINEPVEGETPDLTADIELITIDEETIELKDIAVEWFEIQGNTASPITDLSYEFKNKTAYNISLTEDVKEKLEKEYYLDNIRNEYLNGTLIELFNAVVINGYKKIDYIYPILYEGEKIPFEMTYKLEDNDGTKETKVKVEWSKIKEGNKIPEKVEENEVAEKGYVYFPSLPIPEDILYFVNIKTEFYYNGIPEAQAARPEIKPLPKPTSGTSGSESIEVPETGDEVEIVFLISIASLISLISLSIINKKLFN